MTKLPVDISATFADSQEDTSVSLHQQHHDIVHAAVNNQVSKGDLVFNLRDQPGVVGDGVSDDSNALQSALDEAATTGARAFANGTFRTTRTLRIAGNADLSDATINFEGDKTAVEVGASGTYAIRKMVRLPQVIAALKTKSGWSQVPGSVGVLVTNSYNLDLTVPHIRNFETGLAITGNGRGTSYCNITLGHLDNNKRNILFSADASGWANQNNLYGGRLSHNSNEGTKVPGSRQILVELTTYKVNANSFWGTSIESANVVEYHLDCAGNDNYFVNCRWENTEVGARVIWRADSVGNIITYGYGSHMIQETNEARTANLLVTRTSNRMVGNGGRAGHAVLSVENRASSSLPALRIMGAGAQGSSADENTEWAVELSASKLRGKRTTDAYERVGMDNVNGRLYVGNGAAATTKYLGAAGNLMGFGGGSVCFFIDNTYDLGVSSHRPRYIRAATGVQTGAFRRTARPSASSAGVGTCIFDTTLGKPIWSTGSVWVDATGKRV